MLARIAMKAAGALVMTGTGWGQWTAAEEAKLTASDAAAQDEFGISIGISGVTVVVGAELDDHTGGANAGSAYAFVQSGTSWSEQQKLVAGDTQAQDSFGWRVALSDDTALVGAPSDDHAGGIDAGSAYVFVRSAGSWSELQRLTASDAASGARFGSSVAIAGDRAVIGANEDDHGESIHAGSAYVFVRSGTSWIEEAKLTASDPETGARFGTSVALSGDTVLVGAPFHINSGHPGGSAYAFVRSGKGWSEQTELTPGDGAKAFGWSVAVAGDTAVVGAPEADHAGGLYAGRACVYVRSGTIWNQEAVLVASDAEDLDRFGNSVAVLGDTALVGAWEDDANTGSAYLFVRSGMTWNEREKLVASDAAKDDYFGSSVGLSGELAVVGAVLDNHSGAMDAGSAYVFRFSPDTPLTYCTAGTSASGCQATLSASGTPSASAPSGFVLMASAVEGAKDGLFFFATNGQQANPWGNGTSYQCVVPPVVRTPLMMGTGTNGLCDGSFALDLNALWCPSCPHPSKNPGASATVQAQLWYRDPASTSNQTTSLSDAIEFGMAP